MKKSVKHLAATCCLVSVFMYSQNKEWNDSPSKFSNSSISGLKNTESLTKNENSQHGIVNSTQFNQNQQERLKAEPLDWTKAPNSYIFDPSQNNGGIIIPVAKAYAMWQNNKWLGVKIPDGKMVAEVLWEDVHGLIKTGASYSLELTDSAENAKIRVPVNKSKKGNAVVALRINGEIYWSWHIWVTDDPTNGSTYKSYPGVTRQRSNGVIEVIPDSDWKWMDRNLGAISNSMTSSEWNRGGGLLYQWGRKDPIPSLVTKSDDFYEVSGTIGRIRHRQAKNMTNAATIDNLTKYVTVSNALVENNMKLAVKNPLSLIYVNKDDNTGQAYYNNNLNLPVNWFGKASGIADAQLGELNLWSDNSQGKIITTNYNADANANPYRDKSPFDPCPNGWRIPSVLVANQGSTSYIDDIRIDYSPFGVRTNLGKNTFEANKYHLIKPTDAGVPGYMTGFRVYANFGFDMSNVGGNNMGVFPGSGQLIRNAHEGQYSDEHHTALWTATMPRHFDASPAVGARMLWMIPDKDQPDIQDPNIPNAKGRFFYMPLMTGGTSDANACRCIKDPLYIVNNYNFPTEYLTAPVEYREGINNPNSYQMVKNTVATTIEIPVSKAFSVQSQLLNNQTILDPSSFNNLKANVLWTTNTALVGGLSIVNPAPSSVTALANSKISVVINPNQSGNAVVTLHNGSITNPVYWSWHIWVTDTPIASKPYVTELPLNITNYVNYVTQGYSVLQTEFMDRNLGATDAFPLVANPLTPTSAELLQIRASAGLHYQWGRKDPIPILQNADNRSSNSIFLGNMGASGSLTYTTLNYATYNNLAGSYIIPYNTYSNAANANVLTTDKPSEKVAKVLSYSVKNPLVYMIPSTYAAYNSAQPLYTNGTDWLATEPNLASDRWGRGGPKSPFDPCPEGWRIPDVTSVSIVSNQDFGHSPWYKKGKNAASWWSVLTDYLGVRVRNSTSTTIGYMYNDPAYSVGSYPNSGSRGIRSVIGNQTAQGTYNVINFQYPGIWTDALNSNYLGRPVNIMFDAASTANRMIAYNDNNDPYFGMNCRCVKMKFEANGSESGPIPKLQITSLPLTKPSAVLKAVEVVDQVKENKISLFPNPVKDILYIKAPEERGYFFQVYNMSGQIVKSGEFENGKTDLSTLVSGVYLVRVNSDTMVKIIKQ
ncbi:MULTISPECIES: T9SS type A sorting domain-containing protein [unclassified Chryseobacterium]|uniref:T9SS type A sorting domain-containing protein n=1 Tax=unclassified Chryseobacterium TaxID=2593645 RepID=UPI0022698504|nr:MULTISPECIES: T9SS type A sorting domain-containing protein [unclassified Chryseobacterium]